MPAFVYLVTPNCVVPIVVVINVHIVQINVQLFLDAWLQSNVQVVVDVVAYWLEHVESVK